MNAYKLYVLVCMIFCHIVDDYYLQGVLAKLKQRKFWEENAPQKLYKHDYIVALITHGLSWSFMIGIPVIVYWIITGFFTELNASVWIVLFLVGAVAHSVIDNAKCNILNINLVIDQLLHLLQILFVWIICVV